MDYAREIKRRKGRSQESVGNPKRGGRSGHRLRWQRYALILALIAAMGLVARYWWREHRWRYIVVHHSASDIGNLEYYRRLHMEERGWPDIAYHFVVNNGTADTAVGQVEESALWRERHHHYSTRSSIINYFGIAIVLVGNFDQHDVPPLQKAALQNLIIRLAREYEIPPERIVGHREIWATACPGKHVNMQEIRTSVTGAISAQ